MWSTMNWYHWSDTAHRYFRCYMMAKAIRVQAKPSLCTGIFYQHSMYKDMAEYAQVCLYCKVTKGHYAGPDMQQGSLVVHILMDLLCINFTKLNPSKDSKEDVLVLTDAFSKFSQAFVTLNQKPITVTKLLMDKLFYAYRILAWINYDKGHSFANKILEHLYALFEGELCSISQLQNIIC